MQIYAEIFQSFRLIDTVTSVRKLYEPYLRIKDRALRIAYTDIDFTKKNVLCDQLSVQYALICLINHVVSRTHHGNISLIIGYDNKSKLLTVHISTEEFQQFCKDNKRKES